MYDYQVRGFFKEACGALKKVAGTKSSQIKAHKKQVDNLIFVEPRQIPMDLHGMTVDNCQRPLRASTAQGERVSLANSEVAPAGTTIEFTVKCLVDSDTEAVKEWLEYGTLKGLGQWRNSGKGRFSVEYLDDEQEKAPRRKGTVMFCEAEQRHCHVAQSKGDVRWRFVQCSTAKAK